MIVGFSKYSSGGGSGPVHYLTSAESPDGTARTPAPEVVRGDPELVRRLIDSLSFERTYTSGVLSFAPGEAITPAMEEAIMDAFERVAFAGLAPDRYRILWVRHQHAGHHELHFVTPRVELATGKSLNIHPPGRASQEMFDTFRSQVNAEYGLADPDDPARARDVSLPNHLAKLQADASRKGKARKVDIRDAITTAVRREVNAGRIKDRRGVERYLERLGFTFTRKGKEYLTVVHPDTRERIRLKGSLYSREQFNARETAEPGVIYGMPDPGRAAELAATLEPMMAARARFHQQRYAVARNDRAQQDIVLPGGTQEPLRAYLERHLGAEALRSTWQPHRQRIRTAINAQPQETGRGPDDRAGAAITRRLTAFGAALSGAGRRYDAAFADLDRACGRLERAGGALSAGAAAIEDSWEWLKYQFYRYNHGWNQGYDDGIEP
jgi:Relaxase/Mobilisation nuclease domain